MFDNYINIYNAAINLRLSKEDEDAGQSESILVYFVKCFAGIRRQMPMNYFHQITTVNSTGEP